jgi:hypothetical protein
MSFRHDPTEDAIDQFRFHTFHLDLSDKYWHEISVITKFDPTRDAMRVYGIGYESFEK